MAKIKKDGGHSWFVLFLVTFTLFLEVGIIKAFSVLLPDIKEQLNTHTWIVGSSIGIMTGFGSTVGVLCGGLVPVFGARLCMTVCAFLGSIGLAICSLATTPTILLIGLLLAGFLFVQETIAVGIVPEYFERYYTTAVGIYSTGTALAMLIFPLVTEELMKPFGWRGTLLLLSGVFINTVPCVALLRRPKTAITDASFELETQPILKINEESDSEKTSVTQYLVRKLGLHLMLRVDFVTRVFVPRLVLGYTLDGWLIYMVSFVLSKGTDLKTATIVVTNGGVGMLIVRVAVPLFHRCMSYKHIIYISSVVMAVCLTLMTVSSHLVILNILSLLYGAAVGVFGAELFIAAKVNCKESETFYSLAWLNLTTGWAAILSAFFSGFFYDMTDSFTISFNILAGASLVATLSYGLGDILTREK